MRQISSTRAKQNFGELLEAATKEPVAIEKHQKVKAILVAPEFLAQARQQDAALAARREARARQAAVEKDRLMKHQRIAIELLAGTPQQRRQLLRTAQDAVHRWDTEALCSADYIERWRALLRLPPRELALAMVTDLDGWGTALRQNSPWAEAAR